MADSTVDTSDKGTTDTPGNTTTTTPDDTSNEVEKWKAMAKKHEAEAKTNAGAAKRLAEIEEANKTDAQRNADRLAAAEQAAADAMREALKFKIASKFQIGDEDADLFLHGADEATLTRQAQRLVERDSDRKKNGNHAPRQGTTTTSVESDDRVFARELFGG